MNGFKVLGQVAKTERSILEGQVPVLNEKVTRSEYLIRANTYYSNYLISTEKEMEAMGKTLEKIDGRISKLEKELKRKKGKKAKKIQGEIDELTKGKDELNRKLIVAKESLKYMNNFLTEEKKNALEKTFTRAVQENDESVLQYMGHYRKAIGENDPVMLTLIFMCIYLEKTEDKKIEEKGKYIEGVLSVLSNLVIPLESVRIAVEEELILNPESGSRPTLAYGPVLGGGNVHQNFGANRTDQKDKWDHYHTGIDEYPPEGSKGKTTLIAPVSGLVLSVKEDSGGKSGKYVTILGTDGFVYFLCHNEKNSVKVGEHVDAGQKIGIMGNTGVKNKKVHLHFGIFRQWPDKKYRTQYTSQKNELISEKYIVNPEKVLPQVYEEITPQETAYLKKR